MLNCCSSTAALQIQGWVPAALFFFPMMISSNLKGQGALLWQCTLYICLEEAGSEEPVYAFYQYTKVVGRAHADPAALHLPGPALPGAVTVFTNGAIYLLLALGNSDCVASAEIPKQKQAIKQPC